MKRPDLNTLACVNAECQLFRRPGASNLVIRKVYGHDHIRLLRCRTCGEELRFHEIWGNVTFLLRFQAGGLEGLGHRIGQGH
jgi:hypothetical protein